MRDVGATSFVDRGVRFLKRFRVLVEPLVAVRVFDTVEAAAALVDDFFIDDLLVDALAADDLLVDVFLVDALAADDFLVDAFFEPVPAFFAPDPDFFTEPAPR